MDHWEMLDTIAARIILSQSEIMADFADEHKLDLRFSSDQLSELSILTLIRAAGWLIGFAGADPNNEAHITEMIRVHGIGLGKFAKEPLRGAEGKLLTEFVQKALLAKKGMKLDPVKPKSRPRRK